MNAKRRDTSTHAVAQEITSTAYVDYCTCLPISHLCTLPSLERKQTLFLDIENGVSEQPAYGISSDEDDNQLVPVTHSLNSALRSALSNLFPRSTELSVLLLHVSQLEHTNISPQTEVVYKRHRYHASNTLLEQIMINVQRAIREDDQLLIDTGKGAAIILPGVDQQGAYRILERIYHSVCLLQAETIIPPLTRETDIVMGIGTYPEPGQSLEQLLANAGSIARRQNLRPAITTHLWDTMPARETSPEDGKLDDDLKEEQYALQDDTDTPAHILVSTRKHAPDHNARPADASRQDSAVPFLRLPVELPTRLKNLVPHSIALQLRCVPVGRDHHCLTIAMANPRKLDAIHRLREVTGMAIFPVSCEVEALDTLLAKKW